jgi:hypothetical protein
MAGVGESQQRRTCAMIRSRSTLPQAEPHHVCARSDAPCEHRKTKDGSEGCRQRTEARERTACDPLRRCPIVLSGAIEFWRGPGPYVADWASLLVDSPQRVPLAFPDAVQPAKAEESRWKRIIATTPGGQPRRAPELRGHSPRKLASDILSSRQSSRDVLRSA